MLRNNYRIVRFTGHGEHNVASGRLVIDALYIFMINVQVTENVDNVAILFSCRFV